MRKDLLRRHPGTGASAAAATVAFVVGGLLVLWSTYIHFHLWQSVGYKHLPTIGPLFLLQWIGGLILGLLILALRRVWLALGGIGFALSTMAGFLLCTALPKGLFNFKESWDAPFAHEAFIIEVAIVVVLAIAGTLCLVGSAPTPATGTAPVGSPVSGA